MRKQKANGQGTIIFFLVAFALFSSMAEAGSTGTLVYYTILTGPPPEIQLVTPTPYNGTYNSNQTINVTANSNNLSTIVIYVNGSIAATCFASPCSHNLSRDGNYTFYAVANDTSGQSNTTETRKIVIDMTPPQWSLNATSPAPATYSPIQPYQFNVTWKDNTAVNIVIIEHNFTGTLTNYTITGSNADEYYYSYMGLATGTYAWKMYANDTMLNRNATDQFTYTVQKAVPALNLTSTYGWNTTYGATTTVNCTADNNEVNATLWRNGTQVAIPDTQMLGAGEHYYVCNTTGSHNYSNASTSNTLKINKTATLTYLYLDGSRSNLTKPYGTNMTASATTTYGNTIIFRNGTPVSNPSTESLAAGTYNFTAINPGNDNATGSRETWFLTVQPITDGIYLYLNGNLNQNVAITFGTTSNATAVSTSGSELMYRNGTNVADPEIATLGAGVYEYRVNTTGTQNYSADPAGIAYLLTVNPANSTCSLTFDKTSAQTYGTNITAGCSCTNPEIRAYLFRNSTDVTTTENNTAVTLPAGDWAYSCTIPMTRNYTSATNSSTFTINKAPTTLNLTASPGWNETYGNTTIVSCTASNYEGTLTLWRDGTMITTPDTQMLSGGSHLYVCNMTESANYFSASTSNTLEIERANTTTYLFLNGIQADLLSVTGMWTTATANTTNGSVMLYRNGTNVTNPETIMLAAGYYNYTAINPGNENYTGSYATWFLTVQEKTISTCSLTFAPSSPSTYGIPVNASCACTNPQAQATLWRNGTNVTSTENNTAIILPASQWNYTCNVTDTTNYTSATNTSGFRMKRAVPFLNFTATPGWNNTYGTITVINCTANTTETTPTLLRNGTPVSIPDTQTLGVGEYLYICNITETQNYTNSSLNNTLFINKAPSNATLYLNGSRANLTVVFGTATNATAVTTPGSGYLLRNGTSATNTTEIEILAPGFYNYTAYNPGDANHTGSYETWFLTVQKANSSVNLLFNGIDNDTTIGVNSVFNITALLTNGQGNITILQNGTIINIGTSPLQNLTAYTQIGDYNITVIYYGNQNYSGSSETHIIHVIDDSKPNVQLVDPTPYNGTYNSRQIINVTASDNALANISIYVNGSIVATCGWSPCEYTIDTDGNYTFYAVATDTSGNTNNTEARNIMIDKTPPLITVIIPQNITYTNQTVPVNISSYDIHLDTTWFFNGTANETYAGVVYRNFTEGWHTLYAWANDTFGNINLTSRTFAVDLTGPSINLSGPPAGHNTANSTIVFNWTATDTIDAVLTCNLTVDGIVNQSIIAAPNATPTTRTVTGFADGNHTWNATCWDDTGHTTTSEMRTFTVNTCVANMTNATWSAWENISICHMNSTLTQRRNTTQYDANYCGTASNTTVYEYRSSACNYTAPLIIDTELSPYAIINGTDVTLYIDAQNFAAVWATIRRPDGGLENVTLTDEANTLYGNTALLGVYNVTFYANNSAGETVSARDYFEAFRGVLVNLNVTNTSILGINSTFISYYRNGSVAINSSANGYYVLLLANTTLDLEFYAYDNKVITTTYNTPVSIVSNSHIGMDRHNLTTGDLLTAGISPNWPVTDGKLKMYYNDASYSDESKLRLYKCDDYNFTARVCTGSWTDVSTLATKNTIQHYFEIRVASFSGFAIREETTLPPTICTGCGGGGGGGGEDEPEECIENWKCGPWNACFNGAQTRECIDLNACGTAEYMPFERRICYVPCTPKWNCSGWSECTPEGKQARECNDANTCKTTRGRPATSQECEHDFCSNGIQDNGEGGVDCGGQCDECMLPVLERPKLLELAEANILCTITPLLAVVLLILLILIKAAKIPPRATRILAIINIELMIFVLVFLLPFTGKPEGACMAVANSLPLIDEILLFLSVTFTIALIEAIAYLAIKRRGIPVGETHTEKRDTKLLALLILTGGITLYTLSRIAVKYVSESRYLGDATGALYIALVGLVIIAVMYWEASRRGGEGKGLPEKAVPPRERRAKKGIAQGAARDLQKIVSGISESVIVKEHDAAMTLQRSERKLFSNIRHAEEGIASKVLKAEHAAGSNIGKARRKIVSALHNLGGAMRSASISISSSISKTFSAKPGQRKTGTQDTPIKIVMLKDKTEPRIPIPVPAKRLPPAKPEPAKKRKGPSAIQRLAAAILPRIHAHPDKAHTAHAIPKPAPSKKAQPSKPAPEKMHKGPSAIQRMRAAIISRLRAHSQNTTNQAIELLEDELATWKNKQASIDDELHDLEMQMSGILRYREDVLKSTDELRRYLSGSRINETKRNEISKQIEHITGNVTSIEQKIKTLLDRKAALTKTREQANAQFKQVAKRMEEEKNKLKRKETKNMFNWRKQKEG